MYKMGILDQINLATRKGNRAAFAIGGLLGAFVPVAVFVVVHGDLKTGPNILWALVLGGLIYSATSVVQFGKIAFGSIWKAIGFVVLVEGVSVLSTTLALSIAALVILAAINALSTGYRLVAERKMTRADSVRSRSVAVASKASRTKAAPRRAVATRRAAVAAVA